MDMDITPFYISLRKAVEETIGRPMKTPNDFLWLKEKLQDQLGETLSLATLERFWGYAKTVQVNSSVDDDNKRKISSR
jgi:hypothetical protein